MPLSMFHVAAGLPLLVRRKAFVAYVATNMFIDIEMDVRMALHDPEIHGAFHTLPVVLLLAAIVRIWSKGPIFWGMLFGGVMHVLLDSLVHPDVPLFLFTLWNPFYGLLSWGQVEALCLGLGAIAFFLVDPVRGRLARSCSGLAKRLGGFVRRSTNDGSNFWRSRRGR